MATGSRTEIVRNVGLSLTNLTRFARDQSTYSVESAPSPVEDQNSNSSASLLNSGTFFMPSAPLNFASIHIANRDRPDQLAPDRVCNKEQPSARCLSQSPVAFFARRVPNVAAHHRGLVKKTSS